MEIANLGTWRIKCFMQIHVLFKLVKCRGESRLIESGTVYLKEEQQNQSQSYFQQENASVNVM